MINLLPPDTKKAYFYAKSNQNLLKWLALLATALIILAGIGTYGWINLHQSIKSNQNKATTTQALLTKENLSGTEKQIQTISNDFSLVVKVLSQEVVFSKLLNRMAAAMPYGSVLTNLNIANTAGGSGLDITANASDYTTATQVQVNLSDPANGIFARADIVSITCSAVAAPNSNPLYPCTVILRAQFAKNNQFLFINQKAVK